MGTGGDSLDAMLAQLQWPPQPERRRHTRGLRATPFGFMPLGLQGLNGDDEEFMRRIMEQSAEEDIPRVERASRRDIARLPVRRLTCEDMASTTEDQKSCTICMEEFKEGDQQKTLPCFHRYHAQCVDQWLQRNGCCPCCKHRIEDPRRNLNSNSAFDS